MSRKKKVFRQQRQQTFKRVRNNASKSYEAEVGEHGNVEKVSKFDSRERRRGVSIFQRQLFKRKKWVAQYEDKKDQKRRDRRKKMRVYFRALKDLNREHIQIFGHSISTHSKSKQKFNHISRNKNVRKDVWHELRYPSYHQKQKQKQRKYHFLKSLKTNFNQNQNQNRNQNGNQKQSSSNNPLKYDSANKPYANVDRGNKETVPRKTNGEIEFHSHSKNRRFNSNNYSTYAHARMEGKRNRIRREKERKEREIDREKRKILMMKYENKRERRNHIMNARTRKGQPKLNSQMILLLEKIQNKQRSQQILNNDKQLLDNSHHSEEDQRQFGVETQNEIHSWNSIDSDSDSDD